MSTRTINVVDVFIDNYATLQKIIAYRTGTTQTGQDLTQDIYFRILTLANTFPTYDDARNYLIRVAINAATDHVRTEYRRSRLLQGLMYLFDNHTSSVEDDFHYKEQVKLVEKALSSLPEKCGEVLYLSRVEGMTHTEIAQQLGVSRSLVEKYAVRSLLHCRVYLQQGESE